MKDKEFFLALGALHVLALAIVTWHDVEVRKIASKRR